MKTLTEILAEHRFLAFRIIDGDDETGEGHQAIPMCRKCGDVNDWPVHVAAAYREARTITTREQLDALPEHAVILDREGDVSQLRGAQWCGYETIPLAPSRMAKYLPAFVLWMPGDTP